MDYSLKHIRPFFAFLFIAALALNGCSSRDNITEKSFVGKWKQSKLETPIYLYDNGEWEIKSEDGAVLQYGVWQYKDKKITWGFKQRDSSILRDVNPVLSATPQEFRIREVNGDTTIFTRLN